MVTNDALSGRFEELIHGWIAVGDSWGAIPILGGWERRSRPDRPARTDLSWMKAAYSRESVCGRFTLKDAL
jgi:hypothetical protein